jgi:hypothetical protein
VVPREITIAQAAPGSVTGSDPLAGLSRADPIPDLAVGAAALSAAAIAAGGFDSVALSAGDSILFDGSVTLAAGRSISLTAGTFGATTASGAATWPRPTRR